MVKGRKLYQRFGKRLFSSSLPLIQGALAMSCPLTGMKVLLATGLSGGQADALSVGRECLNLGKAWSTHWCCIGTQPWNWNLTFAVSSSLFPWTATPAFFTAGHHFYWAKPVIPASCVLPIAYCLLVLEHLLQQLKQFLREGTVTVAGLNELPTLTSVVYIK